MKKDKQKQIFYILMFAGVIWMYASYVPFLMDYYVMRPEEDFLLFYQQNILDVVYGFETKLIALVLVGLCCVVRSGSVGVTIMSVALFVLTHGSYIKYLNRRELLRLGDLQLTEAAGMAMNYLEFEWDKYMGFLAGGLLLFVLAAVVLAVVKKKWLSVEVAEKEKKRSDVYKVLAGVGTGVALLFTAVTYSEDFFVKQNGVDVVDGTALVREHGNQFVLYSFVRNDNLKTITAENVAESYDYFLKMNNTREGSMDARPNVIVLMNESWWNTDYFDASKIRMSQDPMAPYKNPGTDYTKGYLTSNVYGGGTVSSEAEFLTGINTKYCAGDTLIYSSTLDRKLPSLVDYFKALDYHTTAIHPYYGYFYNRETAYENMEFDKIIFDEDMNYRDIYTQYISDESLANQIIHEYENTDGNKFIWAISIANHKTVLQYEVEKDEDYDFPISIELESENLSEQDREVLVSYVNGIYNAGKAYEMLVEYFAQKDEPVVVVMFGDHIPNFSEEVLHAVGLESQEESEEHLQKLYSVPIVMWKNYETEEIEAPMGENIFYLPQMLLEYADLPDSEMARILRCQREVFRSNARKIVTDADGNVLEQYSEEQLQMLNHSKSVAYDLMFGESVGQDVWQPIKK